jgi:hypothetical protein
MSEDKDKAHPQHPEHPEQPHDAPAPAVEPLDDGEGGITVGGPPAPPPPPDNGRLNGN